MSGRFEDRSIGTPASKKGKKEKNFKLKKNQKKRHCTSDPISVDSDVKNRERYMLFKKMDFFLKPYYKEYYNEKEHMEFSDEERKPKETEKS